MEIILNRTTRTNKSTIGELLINGVFECYTLEDFDRGLTQSMDVKEIESKKVYGETAIPKGRYEVVVTYSNAFKQLMPLLLNVKGYAGIRIHSGNNPSNSLGCILVGTTKAVDFIGNSRVAYKSLFSKIQKAVKNEKVFITIN